MALQEREGVELLNKAIGELERVLKEPSIDGMTKSGGCGGR